MKRADNPGPAFLQCNVLLELTSHCGFSVGAGALKFSTVSATLECLVAGPVASDFGRCEAKGEFRFVAIGWPCQGGKSCNYYTVYPVRQSEQPFSVIVPPARFLFQPKRGLIFLALVKWGWCCV